MLQSPSALLMSMTWGKQAASAKMGHNFHRYPMGDNVKLIIPLSRGI